MKAGAREEAAYQRAKAVKESAYKQGFYGLPLHGEPLEASNFIEGSTGFVRNVFYEAYQRGHKDRLSK